MQNLQNENTLFTELESCDNVADNQNALQIFESAEFGKVRVIGDTENPLFCLADIAKILEIKNSRDLQSAIDKEFDKGGRLNLHPLKTNGGIQKFVFINESELYFVLMRSDKPKAKPFRLWVTQEVLPNIRKTGKYEVQTQFKIPQTYAEALLEAGRLALENEKMQAQIAKQKPLVEFAENVACSVNSISVGEFAKILGIKGFGQNNLFAWLRNNGYLMNDNEPYQKFVDCGYFEIKQGTYATAKGINTYSQTLITGKGQIYFSDKIVKDFADE